MPEKLRPAQQAWGLREEESKSRNGIRSPAGNVGGGEAGDMGFAAQLVGSRALQLQRIPGRAQVAGWVAESEFGVRAFTPFTLSCRPPRCNVFSTL